MASPLAAANVLLTGNSFSGGSDPILTANLALLGHTYTDLSPGLFTAADLAGRDVVWLDGFSHYPGLDAAALTDFVRQGGRLLVQNPGFGSQPLAEYPFGSELVSIFESRTSVRIATAHLINEGLTEAGLSNWAPSSTFGYFQPGIGSFTKLTSAATPNEVVTVVRPVGAGLIIYTHQGISQALQEAVFPLTDPRVRFLANALASTCTAGADALCLADSRFRVTATYRPPGGEAAVARVGGLTPDTGYLWFFDASNVEAVIKVLPACVSALGNKIWLFAGGLTNVEVVLTATDFGTGAVKTYTNPLGQSFQPIQDTAAFATCP